LESEKDAARFAARANQTADASSLDIIRSDDDFINPDNEDELELTYDEVIANRTDAILKTVFAAYEARMFTKSTSRGLFYEFNKDKARDLAIKEYEEELANKAIEEVHTLKSLNLYKFVDVDDDGCVFRRRRKRGIA